jgi:hypothetical protein
LKGTFFRGPCSFFGVSISGECDGNEADDDDDVVDDDDGDAGLEIDNSLVDWINAAVTAAVAEGETIFIVKNSNSL